MPNVAIVLVEPIDDLNIGMVARAMRNLGVDALRIVATRPIDARRVNITAREGISVFERAQIYPTLSDAIADCEDVVGFSARDGSNELVQTLLNPWAVSQREERRLIHTAVLFGPEDTGLRTEHMIYCRQLVRIPAAVEYSSFNLAQAVLLALYELSFPERAHANVSLSATAGHKRATMREYEALDAQLHEAMLLSRFIRKGTPKPIPGLVKMIFRRLELERREMAILLGLFGKVVRSMKRLSGGDVANDGD